VLPSIPIQVSHAVLLSASNGEGPCIYLAGGRRKNKNGISDLYSTVYEFDLSKKQWKERTAIPYSLCAGTGIATEDNQLLLFGGDRGETFQKVEMCMLKISNEKNDSIKQLLIEEKIRLQASHPGFSKGILQFNCITGKWKFISNIPYEVPATTTAVKWENDVLIPTGEIRAGVRTPNILLGELSIK
jgi:N-acetylneuraminic acid mutarotase